MVTIIIISNDLINHIWQMMMMYVWYLFLLNQKSKKFLMIFDPKQLFHNENEKDSFI